MRVILMAGVFFCTQNASAGFVPVSLEPVANWKADLIEDAPKGMQTLGEVPFQHPFIHRKCVECPYRHNDWGAQHHGIGTANQRARSGGMGNAIRS